MSILPVSVPVRGWGTCPHRLSSLQGGRFPLSAFPFPTAALQVPEPSAGSESQSSQSAGIRDVSSCGLCEDTKSFNNRNKLYSHYSTVHFSKSLKQFVNVKGRICNICGKVIHEMQSLLRHVGATHDKVEQFLALSLHVPKGQTVKQKSSDHECNLCQKQFSARYHLQSHLALCNCKEEFK